MKKVQNTLLASGKTVSCTKLCVWLGLPRSTAYHQPRQRRSKPLDEVMAARIKQIDLSLSRTHRDLEFSTPALQAIAARTGAR